MTTKKLVATHDKIDPAMVTSDDLVRAMKQDSVVQLATRLGWHNSIMRHIGTTTTWQRAAHYIAQRITLPEDGEVLPFSEPINGWRGEE